MKEHLSRFRGERSHKLLVHPHKFGWSMLSFPFVHLLGAFREIALKYACRDLLKVALSFLVCFPMYSPYVLR